MIIATDIDSESYNLVTCYCGKPYAARPMIECSKCLTWLHFSCAKIKRKHIPEVFICIKCSSKISETNITNSNSSTITNKNATINNQHNDVDNHTYSNEPKENDCILVKAISSIPLNRIDKSEKILQPLNVSASLVTASNANNIKPIEPLNTSVIDTNAIKSISNVVASNTPTAILTTMPINITTSIAATIIHNNTNNNNNKNLENNSFNT